MDKYTWKQVKSLSSSSHKPSSRWGHSCCVVGQDIVFFGGYADSNYMNDLWAFNSVTMKWRQIQTTGDIPAQRSNCSMNYDKQNNQIVIFGGGGSNKQRYNTISILNWESKEWIEINPKQNQVAPWQRTYHVAELMFPYLIVFGGEGVADMDDLWIFNFNTLGWSEVKIGNDKVKPCARRFHSSVRIGNQFIVLAGCHGKYRCLSDVFSMDMTPLLKTGKVQGLEWKEKKLKNSSFLTRWGHSSVVYENKIYVFGGRFSNDLNDLLVADFQTNTIKSLKISQEAPAARRRHCAGFIGSTMLIFGGFNGQYFNDLHYISLHQSKPKFQISTVFDQKVLSQYINNKSYADYKILSQQGEQFYINIGLIAKYFQNDNQLFNFLESVQNSFSVNELQEVFTLLYYGYGENNLKHQLKSYFQNLIFQTKNEKLNHQKALIEKTLDQDSDRKLIKKSINSISPLIKLNEQDLIDHFLDIKHKNYADCDLFISNHKFSVNKIKLIAKSQYFKNLFQFQSKLQKITLMDILGQNDQTVYQIFFNFLQSDFLVVPDNVSAQTYLQLAILADYYCVPVLTQICSNELINIITTENLQKIMTQAIRLKINNVSKACSDFLIKKLSETIKLAEMKTQIKKIYGSNKRVLNLLQQMLEKIGFELSQTILDSEKNMPSLSKKVMSSNSNMEKQNYESNLYSH